MTTMISGDQVRANHMGIYVTKSTGTLAATTVALFTISGAVAITSMFARATTAVTVANSYKVQHNPTGSPTTADIFAATDIGTTDSVLNEFFVVTGLKTDTLVKGALGMTATHILCDTGQIESVSAGTDGVLLWCVTYVPLDTGASLVAA